MKWKKGLPTEVGWYWFCNPEIKHDDKPIIIEVRDYAGRLAIGNNTLHNWISRIEGYWAGPISMPDNTEQIFKQKGK